MMKLTKMTGVFIGLLLLAAITNVNAQQPQIPTLQVCNETMIGGKAVVKIESRKDASHSGTFEVRVKAKCAPGGLPYPDGSLTIRIDMYDSIIQGEVTSIGFEQLTSTGKYSPTAYLSGRCRTERMKGCRFWIMFADNKKKDKKGTPDIIGFLIFDEKGKRVAHGTGPVIEGDIEVAPSPN